MIALTVVLLLVLGWLGFRIWGLASFQPQHVFAALYQKPKTVSDPWRWWKYLASWPWYSNPGWVVKQLSLVSPEQALKQAHIPLKITEFYGFKQWLWTTMSLLFLAWLWFGELSVNTALKFGLITVLLVLLPDLWLKARLAQRQQAITNQVPYFLDLLTLTLQGGGNLEQGLRATTDHYHSELSQAVKHKLRELDWGRPLDELLQELGEEIEDEDWQHFLASVRRAKKLGVSLADTLAVQAELMRTRRRQKAEELSRTAAVKISVPLVLFIFPALLIIYIGPGILQLLEKT